MLSHGTQGQTGDQLIQQGFGKGKSCLANHTSFCDEVTNLGGEGQAVDVHLDYSKALGSVSHSNLLEELASYGMDGCSVHWGKTSGWPSPGSGGEWSLPETEK